MNTESKIPVTGLYADEAPSGHIEPPTNTQFHAGVEPEMTLPAAWWNYFVNLFTSTNIKAKEDITAILAELNSALTTMGITPDPEASNQLATLFQNDVLPVTFANASMNANPYTTSSLVPKHRGNIAINTTTRTTWIATNTTAEAASWSRLWSPENDGSGSGLDADKVRDTTPGTRGLQYLAAAAVSNIATLILADLKTVDGAGSGLAADTATKLATSRTIGGVSFNGSANINLPGVNTAGNQNTTGNAATATKLATARTIAISGNATGSTTFDGSANKTISLTVSYATKAGSATTATTATNAGYATSAGSATTATSAGKLTNARTITVGGDATGSVSFDGSANRTLTIDVITANQAGRTYRAQNSFGTSLPAASEIRHGNFFYVANGSLHYCAQTASSTYKWIKIGTL